MGSLPPQPKVFPLLLLFFLIASGLESQEPRIALVIGNGDYRFFKPQSQPPNDAREMAELLRSQDFDVVLVTDGTKGDMDKAVKDFGVRIRQSGAVGVFYYSGVKVVSEGKMYLPGVDAHMDDLSNLRFEAVDLDFLLFRMRSANNPLNFLFLDISREQPFSPSAKPLPLSFLQDLPKGVNIIVSQDPQVQPGGSPGPLSRMTGELLGLLKEPSLPISLLLQRLEEKVATASAGSQKILPILNPETQFLFNRDTPILALKALETRLPGLAKVQMVSLPGGIFEMGSPDTEEKRDSGETLHKVTLSPFRISSTEVTQSIYESVTGMNPSHFKGANLPVDQVSWYDAIAFCNLLSKAEGLSPAYRVVGQKVTLIPGAPGYRLPTEAEWEYAARAGAKTPFYTGTEITTDHANFNGMVPYGKSLRGMSRERTTDVASYPPNPWGLYDMSGNLWEWCWDYYAVLPSTAQKDPSGPPSGEFRVSRGGSWRSHGEFLRLASRHYTPPAEGVVNIGFRVVRSGR